MESTTKAAMTSEQRDLIAEEDRYRQLFAEDRQAYELDDPHLLLLDVFSLPDNKWQHQGLSAEEKGIPAILTQHAASPSGRSIVGSQSEFQKNWREFSQGMFDGLDWNNVFIAGGAVLGCLTNKGGSDLYGQSDIDVFIYGIEDEDAANRKLKQIHSLIQQNTNSQGSVIRTKRTVTIINSYPFRHVQIILKLYKSPAEVLLGFDVDCCTFGYDGNKVWAMERGRRAITRCYNLVNETRRSTSYEGRLYKYSKRGFIVLVPGLDRNRVHSGIFAMRPWQASGLAKLLIFENKASDPSSQAEEEPDESDYNPDIQIPWGPEWTTSRILAKLNAKDKSQFYANRFRDMSSGGPSSSAHNHLFITGIDELIQGQFWCEQCQRNLQLADESTPGNFVSTRVAWVTKCPAYQDIDKGFKRELMSGSFTPSLDPDWKGMAYAGPPATFVPTRSSGARKSTKKMKKPFGRGPRPTSFLPTAQPAWGVPKAVPAAVPTPAAGLVSSLATPAGGNFTCEVCHAPFYSQNQLRKHVRETGHLSLASPAGPSAVPIPVPSTSFNAPKPSFSTSPSLGLSSFTTPAVKQTAPVVLQKESVERFNPPAAEPFVQDIQQFGPQPGSFSPSSFSFGYASPAAPQAASPQNYGSPYKPPALAVPSSGGTQYADMNPAARALYLISQCFKGGHITEHERQTLKELFIKGSEIITAAVEVYDIDKDLHELFDTLRRIAQS